jgi:hypothetical protein
MNELAEWDWVITPTGHVLHHAATLSDPDSFDEQACGPGVTSCGRTADLSIPGVFSRMARPRCQQCCAAVSFPDGIGSPKNDDTCRPLVEQRLAAPAAG